MRLASQPELRSDAWLDLHPSGRWEASAPPTEAARDLLDLFIPITLNPDLVIGQLGQSLDGRIATVSGDSHYITGPVDIRRLHRLRALVDAVVVGAGTVARDNPRLTVRGVEGENPVRVILDPDDRLSPDRHVFSDGAARTLVLRRTPTESATGESATARKAEKPVRCEVVSLPVVGPDGFDPTAVIEALRTRGLRRVLIEGGGITVSRFLQAGLLDRLHLTVAPLLIGSGQPALTLPPIQTLAHALRPRCRHVYMGEDVLFDLDLR
ncbi:MAG: RibD family protein [Gemmatimonadetes bacterium]|nr:RibD family protein [Gemmatimonadota bacterium]